MPAISPARRAAFRVLLAVERGQNHADDLLRADEVSALAPADRHLATALVLGVLRWQIFLDQLTRPLLKRPNARLDAEVLIALRLGVFQLRFLDRIPDHAAIDESVELTKQSGHRFAAGMVNAVLRSIACSSLLEEGRVEPAAVQAHPAWLVERWISVYGAEAMHAICRHGQSQPRMTVRMESPAVQDELSEAGIELAPGELLAAARTVVSGDVTATPAFHEGRARLQDEGSQLIGELAAIAGEGSNQGQQKILDACAAPGGKTLILAERSPHAQIVACESSPRRLAELRKRLAAYADRVECRLADAAELEADAAFDLALVDVPCSGTGTLGRNPEIRHRLQLEDLPRLAERQHAILRAALRAVRPGGRVVYSTCSLEPEENEQVVAAVLAENSTTRQISLAPAIDALQQNGILRPEAAEPLRRCLTPDGALRLLPGISPTDGFFVALLERWA
ncbi:MAG: transcription antitermination factor NusB [Terracidiphilus sp.]|nr:transcription antitermination factor NusB [Terracidiphilus sp.]MDR3799362.1 transcription antitermination factor NusB [Terracidiphilus sp.]